ncbi:MAG: AbrB/MazE/SpoVT family DNA-binding domain-containing protein [Clostridium perfringens]|nr:AbrB/MazE/SpoVT family DNA-binding domain-containing protein [Clostridium perfringens]
METRNMKVMFAKAGGNAGKDSMVTRISLPKAWVNELGLNKDNRDVKMSFDGEKIVIDPIK